MKNLITTVSTLVLLVGSLNAQVLQLDFGPTVATDDSRLNSPYHTVNQSFTDTDWVQLTNGTPAPIEFNGTTLTLDLGAASNSTTLNLATNPSGNSALGSLSQDGAYAGTSPGRDGIFHGGNATSGSATAVGLQISGLAIGTYDIYIASRNTSSNANYVQNLYVGTTSATGNFSFGSYATQQLSYANPSDKEDSWVLGDNYGKFSISITAVNSVLNLAVMGLDGTGEERAFLNAVQIVAIPEPSTTAILVGAAGLALAASRRTRHGRSTT